MNKYRQTVENVRHAGLEIADVENLRGDLVKLIHARPANAEGASHLGLRGEE